MVPEEMSEDRQVTEIYHITVHLLMPIYLVINLLVVDLWAAVGGNITITGVTSSFKHLQLLKLKTTCIKEKYSAQ